eukprot:SAG31_NODE_975_length_10623_cov_7.244964_16_plen_217_part_00
MCTASSVTDEQFRQATRRHQIEIILARIDEVLVTMQSSTAAATTFTNSCDASSLIERSLGMQADDDESDEIEICEDELESECIDQSQSGAEPTVEFETQPQSSSAPSRTSDPVANLLTLSQERRTQLIARSQREQASFFPYDKAPGSAAGIAPSLVGTNNELPQPPGIQFVTITFGSSISALFYALDVPCAFRVLSHTIRKSSSRLGRACKWPWLP